jgi:hypothetical protein
MSEKLFDEVTTATGLPKETISAELSSLVSAAGLNQSDLTLDELRQILAEYVQDVLMGAKEKYSEDPNAFSAK